MEPLISIIMPVKNGIPYLTECIESIISQSYTKWELLAVDDHSNDKTYSTLSSYAAEDGRIKSLRNIKGHGIIQALKTGYSHSSGNYITRMDADDIMPTNKLASLLSLIKNIDTPSVSTGHVRYFSDSGVGDGYRNYENWLNQLCKDKRHYMHIYRECVIPSPCWMMSRNNFEIIGGFNSNIYPEDYDLAFRMYEHNIQVISCQQVLHMWRDHGLRTSRNDPNYSDNRFLDLKLYYFCKIELPKCKNLVLLGAGKKGKAVAKYLIDNKIKFTWITNNLKKIGKDIYGVILEDYSALTNCETTTAFIVAIANKDDQKEVSGLLTHHESRFVYYFS